jgi:hypothetical protein
MDVFKDTKRVKYSPYLNQGLNSFEDVISVFTKYRDGGYWVKKIDSKSGFYRELVDGPYEKKEAEKKAQFWNKFFQFKDIPTAHVYSFQNLICRVCKKDDEYDKKIQEYLYSEYIWQPQLGMALMCLLNGDLKILLNSVYNRDDDFEKFALYVQELGVVKVTLFEYDIFYLEHEIDSNYKAATLRKLVSDYFENPDQLVWLYDELQGFDHIRGTKPFIIPGYLLDGKKFCMPLDLEFFKKYNKVKECKRKRKVIFNDLKKCLPEFSADIKATEDNVAMVLNAKLITNVKAHKVRDFYISMDKYDNIILGIIYPDDLTYIKVEETKNCRGHITTNLTIKKFDSSMWLMIYLCKVFGFTHLTIDDNFKVACDNYDTVHQNILLFLDDQPSVYDKFGFKLDYKDEKQKNEIISKFQSQDLDVFDRGLVDAYDINNLFPSNNLKDVAHTYFNGMNKYLYTCEVLKRISEKIFNEISDCCLHYTVELRDIRWEELIDNIM